MRDGGREREKQVIKGMISGRSYMMMRTDGPKCLELVCTKGIYMW